MTQAGGKPVAPTLVSGQRSRTAWGQKEFQGQAVEIMNGDAPAINKPSTGYPPARC
jgi:hypothetical protein